MITALFPRFGLGGAYAWFDDDGEKTQLNARTGVADTIADMLAITISAIPEFFMSVLPMGKQIVPILRLDFRF